jgi:hypothetical protein
MDYAMENPSSFQDTGLPMKASEKFYWDVRCHRNMAVDSSCSLCGSPDSWRHSRLECTMSRCVWALVPEAITEHMERTTEQDAKQWLLLMMNTLKQENLTFLDDEHLETGGPYISQWWTPWNRRQSMRGL